MTKRISFNAFEMNCVAHQSPGLWRHEQDRSLEYNRIEYWTDLAKILEQGKFDGIFIADVLGIYDVYQKSTHAALNGAVQVPVNDPLQVIPIMAAVTKHLGFGLTTSVSFEHPYPFARRMSTLDHLTQGRVGWNIVTSYLESGSKNIGLKQQLNHDERYDFADEYLEVLYKLWENSWQQDAVHRNKASGVFADSNKVHAIEHAGKYFSVPGIHLCEPSPQRTPVLYQAGASHRGQIFASQHAECIFIAAPSKIATQKLVKSIEQQLIHAGRRREDVKIYALVSIVTDETDQKATHKFKQYQDYGSREGALTLLSGWSGVDFSQYQATDHVQYVHSNAIQSLLDAYVNADPHRVWTVDEIAHWNSVGGNGPVFVGSATTVADTLQSWVEETGVDGFNLAYILAHQSFIDVVRWIVPELQRRGVYQLDYTDGTLRHKLFQQGDFVAQSHQAYQYKR
ncbi:LLM class flavin-dependent oxidoreductase [Acinetobacter sp. B5B]|uniref:LLM class flavin-dependent oxidoreductase n=1 Tax=Acinetobacter baretiae TaxID=2605383 RepID=UPI0018C23EDF|nr:LLM class flavin-dependent oxidoreductase [Acinetobacter baretiae]MBF7683261.1 LLM class flavin-dependent oxidoreductase [Acinetobacter baretiae]